MKTLKSRLGRFARMFKATCAPLHEESKGLADSLLVCSRVLLVVVVFTAPTFVAVVVFGR